jgi:glycosyltransferase involved in cell wall biosynthesis
LTITAMLRVQNEGRWLGEVVASIQRLTGDIVIFDDHSTDNTRDIALAMGCRILDSPFDASDTNETRDKNRMLEFVRRSKPDYVLAIDGDEVLERHAPRCILAALEREPGVLSFPVRYLWHDREHYRADGVYARFTRASMFRLKDQPAAVKYVPAGAAKCNFHCGNVPAGLHGHGVTLPVDLLHLGYMLREDRLRKFAWYQAKDPDNAYEDGYKHMVLGDLPEYPATMRRAHGGPLKIFRMPQGKWPELSKETIAQ